MSGSIFRRVDSGGKVNSKKYLGCSSLSLPLTNFSYFSFLPSLHQFFPILSSILSYLLFTTTLSSILLPVPLPPFISPLYYPSLIPSSYYLPIHSPLTIHSFVICSLYSYHSFTFIPTLNFHKYQFVQSRLLPLKI